MTRLVDDFSPWVGRSEIVVDDLTPATSAAAAATFDEEPTRFGELTALPPLWHWFYFLSKVPQSKLGGDGHPQREENSFMPPISYPRRMFAGARVKWHRPLWVGQPARREAVIRSILKKSGRSGDLAFVTVAYRVLQDDIVCLEEEQDIVYRQPGPALSAPQPVAFGSVPSGTWSHVVVPDPRLLFRFSALTFNAHRIHYDRPYAMSEEGYPGLVVHGPLTAILLLKLVRDNTSQPLASFSFRSQSPLFDLAPFRLLGVPSSDGVELQAQGPDGKMSMTATAQFASDDCS